jgi:hypothetical protein
MLTASYGETAAIACSIGMNLLHFAMSFDYAGFLASTEALYVELVETAVHT